MQGSIRLEIGHSAATLDPQQSHWVIGRDQHMSNLVAPDPSVSRRHCEVFLQNGRAWIRDMGSSNGTWVNGQPVGQQPVELAPGQQIFVGHMPLSVQWQGGQQGATVMGAIPPELAAMIAARKQQAAVQVSTPSTPAQGDADPGMTHMTYRRQGSNNNGVLLVALPGDTFTNETTIKGFVEFTATDAETVNEIAVELVELHKKGPKKGHEWDRVLVKKGPWKCKRNDRVPFPFELRVPSATSVSSKDVHWEIQAAVDIAWGFDVEVDVPITMRNQDIERLRDAMGALDLRVDEITSKPMGQQFNLEFLPPAQLKDRWNIDQVNLQVQYLGTDLEVVLEVDKRGVFSKDRKTKWNVPLAQLRQCSQQQLAEQLNSLIHRMLSLK